MPYCGECKKECEIIIVDFGIGTYECYGYCGVDSRPADVSNCCEAEVFEDKECTKRFEFEPEPPEPDWPHPDDDETQMLQEIEVDKAAR